MSTVTTGTRLRVIVLAPRLDIPLYVQPFACVVSEAPGEQMYNTTKPCLHVFCCEDNKPDFADGLYASHKETVFVGDPVDWPVLCVALSREPKDYSKPLMPKQGELRFQRVMLSQKYGHVDPPLEPEAEGHALKALKAAERWNGWMEDAQAASDNRSRQKWGFDDALKSIVSLKEWAQIVADGREAKAGDAFRKWCGEIGLVKPHLTDFTTPYNQLLAVLKVALQLHEGVRDQWTKEGKQ